MTKAGPGGFTLLELAIVIVVIGLLIGGILFGQDLIRAAEMRHVQREYTEYITAVSAFRIKYHCLPGDCAVAEELFGTDPSGCPAPADAAAVSAACDGNGDGALQQAEVTGIWQQLAAAGMIAGTYTSASSSASAAVAGYNCPAALSDGHCWYWLDGNTYAYFNVFSHMTDEVAYLGAVLGVFPTASSYWTDQLPGLAVWTPAEALMYDEKYDDGHPDSGRLMAAGDFLSPDCTTPAGVQGGGPYSYDLSKTARNCTLIHVSGF